MALKLGGCGTEHVYHRHLSTTASAERPLAFSVVTDRFARCPDLSDATEHSACHAARPPSSMRPRPVELSYSAHRPADHPAREQVDHGRHIEPAFNRPDVGEVGNPFLIRPRGRELSVQQVGRYGSDLPISLVLRQPAAPWPRPQGLQSHQPFDPVQTTVDAVCQQVSPDPPCTVGPIAGNETRLDLLADGVVTSGSGAGRLVQPGMEARP